MICKACQEEAGEIRKELKAAGVTDKGLIARTAAKAKCKEHR